MAVTAKQLKDHYASLEEQMGFAGLDFSASETFKSLFTPLTQQAGLVVKEHFTRIAHQFEETNKATWSQVAQQLSAMSTECFTKLVQETFGNLERYSGPVYIPSAPYVRRQPTQIVYIIVYDYHPGLN
jgi:hypothetical protein